LTEGRIVLGRSDGLAQVILEPGDVPVPLDDRLVSRRHAIIRADGGQFTLMDAGSTDGTHLNEKDVIDTMPIADGDRLRLGDTMLVASVEGSLALAAGQAPGDMTLHPGPNPVAVAPSVEARPTPLPVVSDADRTVFQAPIVTRRPPDAENRAPMRPPESPTPPSPAAPSTRAPFTPVPTTAATPAPVVPAPVTPARTTSPVTPARTTSPVAPAHQPTPAAPPSQPEAPAARLSDVARTASDLSALMRQLERDLSTPVDMVERAGGRTALLAFLAQARRVSADPSSAEDLESLIRWLPTACRMLEAELLLLNLLSPQASDAPR